MSTRILAAGGYRFIPAVSQYSGGVAAEPGMRLERVRFSRVVPLREAFDAIARHLAAIGRPNTAFAACELRSPAPFTEEGFRAFNGVYIRTLEQWGLMEGAVNPVARSNVCPAVDPPPEPGFFAFSYTVPDPGAAPSFVVAGSAECPEGRGDYRDNLIARGDVSPQGIRTKAVWVLGEMERRMAALGFDWSSATATQVYTVHDFHPFVVDEIVRRGAMRAGITWHLNRPPVQELEFEMDCRSVSVERVITG
jgi:hypothetical protein